MPKVLEMLPRQFKGTVKIQKNAFLFKTLKIFFYNIEF